MKKINFIFFMILLVCSFSFSSAANLNQSKVSVQLFSNKNIYSIGENVNLTLKINNNYNDIIKGQIKGKVIIGDVGYEIQCFDYSAPANHSNYLGLTSLPASLSNSNSKTMTTLYACSGTRMQSSKTMIDNSQKSSGGRESFLIGPFIYSYSYNGSDYDVKSNVLNITVDSSQQQQQQQQNQQQQQSSSQKQEGQQGQQSQNSQNQQNSQNSANSQQSGQNQQGSSSQQNQQSSNMGQQGTQSSLNAKNTKALSQNQQNAKSVNQLKSDIAKAKLNPLNNVATKDADSFWDWFILLVVILLISAYVFYKYIKKEDVVEEVVLKEPVVVIPKYILLLDNIKDESDKKQKAKLLSQAIRNYIASINGLSDEDLTYSKAISLSSDKLLIKLLNDCEKMEFSGKDVGFDFTKLVSELKSKMKKVNEK